MADRFASLRYSLFGFGKQLISSPLTNYDILLKLGPIIVNVLPHANPWSAWYIKWIIPILTDVSYVRFFVTTKL